MDAPKSHNILRLGCILTFIVTPEITVAQWIAQNSTTQQNLRGVSFVDSTHGWVVGDNGVILHTNDGGAVWAPQSSGTTRPLLSVSFCDSVTGWATGNGGIVLRTSDGGIVWHRVPHDSTSNIRHFKVQCLSPSTVFILRDSFEIDYWTNHRIWKTIDSGGTWQSIFGRLYFSQVTDMHFISGLRGWNCGRGGGPQGYTIHRTTNGGVGWVQYWFNPPAYSPLLKVVFDDSMNGWASDGDTLFSSSDGGVSWRVLSVPMLYWLTDLYKSGLVGYAGRAPGGIKKTTDGGLTWFSQPSPSTYIEDLSFVTPDIGWGVGWNGKIVHTLNGGTTSARDPSDIPEGYSLNQNYPNPFNPTTLITFSIPEAAHASVKIYDLLGREVATVLDEKMEPGIHSTTWNASRFASGIYFCRLQSKNHFETKKLLLLR